MIPSPTIVPFELQLYHKHLTLEYRILGCFGELENSLRRNSEIFYRCTHTESDSRLLFQKWSKSVHDKWSKGRIALITKKNKTRFGTLERNPGGDFPHFSCVSAHHAPSRMFQISSREIPVWGSSNQKTCPRGPKVNAI